MNPDFFKNLYKSHFTTTEIISCLSDSSVKRLHIKGLSGSSPAFFFASLIEKSSRPLFIVLNDKEEAAYFYDDISLICNDNKVLFFPSSYKRLIRHGKIEQENIVRRTEVLNRASKEKDCIIVTYPEALVERVIQYDTLISNTLNVSVNEKLSPDFVNEVLYEFGFERVDFVFEPGQYSVRGGIIDIFSFSYDKPYRIDFFGDMVDSIRSFDINTQLSIKKFDSISIIPNVQYGMEEENRIDIFNYLKKDFIIAFHDREIILNQIKTTFSDAIKVSEDEENPLSPEMLANDKNLSDSLKSFSTIYFGLKKDSQADHEFSFSTVPQPGFNKNFDLLAANLKQNSAKGFTNYILSNSEKQIERLQAIFDDKALNVKISPVNFTIHEGFYDNDLMIAMYTDHQIFERYHKYSLQTTSGSKESISIEELNKLHPGDYVVHIDHGIGKFAGLVKTEVNGRVQEAIRLVYRDNDSLLVNIHSLHRISKYKGKDGTEPSINKLGSGAWQKLKSRVKSKVKDIARELIALYAKRLSEKGFSFSPDSYLQQELEASFMYEDTPDQEKATKAVKDDMERLMPMDRLVCGDVGFGKTEVAIRAAFKAATDDKQVAVLVPTTILALQHYKTFTDRLKDFPVKISYLSRLRKPEEIKETLKELAEGKIDIVIGTHKIVGKEVKFKDLGLLVIDEEQKFGVSVKEKLRQLKVNVDTLTLTATPIPRTLQFSLMGARDLSIIQTPPPNRYPIVTEVHGFNEAIIREAINYEIDRNGQVFFIHNRVHNIHEVEEFVRKACPQARIVVGHGQMEGSKLEKTMLDFINGEYDVLIATTIIESGLDIPNANTIIINHAQSFGLSDLHQLRGRVGRSNKKAFCYLLSPPLESVTPEARRRLKAIEEFSELGSGFNIAMRDLDIRGAGNLLGAEQSGFIEDIGYETYHRILEEAIQELKHSEFGDLFKDEQPSDISGAFFNVKYLNDCQIETDLELRFPESYISSVSERMSLYRELDNIEKEEELTRFETRLTDRFGKIPEPALQLFEIVRLRWMSINLGIERIILKNNKMICHFINDQKSPFYQSQTFTSIIGWIQKNHDKCRIKEEHDKLSLTFEKVKTITQAKGIISSITS